MAHVFELGQVFTREIGPVRMTIVLTHVGIDIATFAVAPDSARQVTLGQTNLQNWKRIPGTERDWYIEAVIPEGRLLWSLFIPGFEAAWAFYTSKHPEVAEVGGYMRIGAADDASDGELMIFEDAGGMGPQPFLGYGAAVERLHSSEQ
jgi:hypothetical protein